MSQQEPTRWALREDVADVAQLMREARGVAPDPERLAAMLAGVEAGAVTAGATAGTSAAGSLLPKLALLGAAAVGGSALWLALAKPPASLNPQPTMPLDPIPSAASRVSEPPLTPKLELTPPAPQTNARRPVLSQPTAPAVSAVVSPLSELDLIREARAALTTNPTLSLKLAEQHARAFPGGVLVQEREVLAIEALAGTGRMPEARSRAERFVRSYPKSAYVVRLEHAVGTMREEGERVDP